MKRLVLAAVVAVMTTGASEPAPPAIAVPISTPVIRFSQPPPCYNGCLNPVEAVTYASYLAPRAGVAADFEMTVRAIGEQDGRFYFNSERDYRDRNCLTIAVPQTVAQAVVGAGQLDLLRQRYIGQRIVVRGIAQRVRIEVIDDKGEATGKYYFQIHVRVGSPQQMLVKP